MSLEPNRYSKNVSSLSVLKTALLRYNLSTKKIHSLLSFYSSGSSANPHRGPAIPTRQCRSLSTPPHSQHFQSSAFPVVRNLLFHPQPFAAFCLHSFAFSRNHPLMESYYVESLVSGFFSLNLMFLRFTHAVTLLLGSNPLCHVLFICSSADGHLDCFQWGLYLLGGGGIMNNTPMSNSLRVLWGHVFVSLG